MRKKNDWEKRKIKTASYSMKTPFPLAQEEELIYHGNMILKGETELFNEFLVEMMGCPDKKCFDDRVREFIMKIANLNKGEISQKYRLWKAKKIGETTSKMELKKRMEEYIANEEYK